MKHLFKAALFAVALIISFGGCGRIVDWGTYTFEQSTNLDDIAEPARHYIRSILAYDQFDTAAWFDALWLSDDARTAYANLYARRRGKSEEANNTFLRRQVEETKHFMNFYILTPYENPLGEANSLWQVFLNIDGKIYMPIELKVAELEPEYKFIFGKKFTRFKEPYLIKFDAKDADGNPILTNESKKVMLCFRANDKQAILTWRLNNDGVLIVEAETKYGAMLNLDLNKTCAKK